MDKKTFIFPAKWVEPLSEFDSDALASIMRAIMHYWKTGEISELTPVLKPFFLLLKGDIDNINSAEAALSEKRRKAGKKGGSKTQKNAAKKESKTSKTSIIEYNIIEDNISESERARAREGYEGFLEWVSGNAPYVAEHMELPTEDEFEYLRDTFGAETVAETTLRIENRKDLRGRYDNLYRTIITWMKNGKQD